MLKSAIQEMQGYKMQLILYDVNGYERHLIISCTQYHDPCNLVGCLLTLNPSEAITLQEAFLEYPHARALVSADAPHPIHVANDAFLIRYLCTRSEVLGRPMHLFFGDSSPDSVFFNGALCSSATDFGTAWTTLLSAALEGRVAQRSPIAIDGDGDDVTFVPVVDSPNGRIRYLLITFGPRPHHGGAIEPFVGNCRAPDSGRPTRRRARPTEQLVRAEGAEAPGSPQLRGAGPTIFPRGKPRIEGALAAPVVVTRELVAALAELPLLQAAATAGVSATAFKKACRKLGVLRWAYKRRSPADAARPAADSHAALSGALCGSELPHAALDEECGSGIEEEAWGNGRPPAVQPTDSDPPDAHSPESACAPPAADGCGGVAGTAGWRVPNLRSPAMGDGGLYAEQ